MLAARKSTVRKRTCAVALTLMLVVFSVAAVPAQAQQRPPTASDAAAGAVCVAENAHDKLCVRKGRDNARTGPRTTPRVNLAYPPECEFQAGPDYNPTPTRFLSCSDTVWEVFTTTTRPNGVVVVTGWMNLENLQWSRYDRSTLRWEHGATVAVKSGGWGTLENGLDARVFSGCTGTPGTECHVVSSTRPDGELVRFVPRFTYENVWTEEDDGPAATEDTARFEHRNLGVRLVGAPQPDVPAWSFDDLYLVGRCDSRVTGNGNINRGCVNQDFTPTLQLSIAQSGSSAWMVAWAQGFSRHWGREEDGKPLHYQPNYDTGRRIMCGDMVYDEQMNAALSQYTPPDRDTCDEFPFAATYENPANYGGITSGSQCAQGTAVQIPNPTGVLATDWPNTVPLGNPTFTEPCVRAHIPGRLNSSVGGRFGNLVTANRLVDRDGFWIRVDQ
ncbi:hypothetical protein EV193_10243 [Herbihabitans rhizosphaerae]|uniref:Uncharacterized protein n=1 Tax=Herbihabitans rhizosphaerae TaxID=1872711 RepID=A0A4Q7L1K5_9PSEU|nr:hypothetical protein [Herbihabitans rhizosphaerae]RZS43067.1 hypothetical protein EV193_10243 [Herbihabitans rhizosphaerae]